jgi:tetratricopeptide (TPR) repeat protein
VGQLADLHCLSNSRGALKANVVFLHGLGGDPFRTWQAIRDEATLWPGQREEALAAANEAAGLYRDLARARPEAFTPNLAASLNNLANMLSELGQREEALATANEVIIIQRDLARAARGVHARSGWVAQQPRHHSLRAWPARGGAGGGARGEGFTRKEVGWCKDQAFSPIAWHGGVRREFDGWQKFKKGCSRKA